MENIIEISHLDKSYKDVKAVNDLSFKVRRGELFAFLGVNGAGKSTTISVMCGSLEKDGGSVLIDGYDVEKDIEKIVAKTGVVFQNSVLDGMLTVKDNLYSRASLYGICGKAAAAKIKELSELLEFGGLLNRTVNKLSGGQRRRIDVARALLNDPDLLILDEPTTGLDPQTRKNLWQAMEKLRKERNMTVFLTTHYMEEAADADYVVIIDGGKIAAEGTPLALKNAYTGDYITVYGASEQAIKTLALPYERIKDAFRVSVKNTAAARDLIISHPDVFNDFEIVKGKMDDVFLAVTGKKLTGEN
ncbi:MAG: ABC transporter ATP-binding protein [Candidatus Borkfalkiaceae bacterium]|nr:ABC transporter ATP-binding protein [Christensenellaceae bacterium]